MENKPTYKELVEEITKLKNQNKELQAIISFNNMKVKSNTVSDLLDSIPGFAFIKDVNLNYIGANRTFCDLLKIPYDEIGGKTDYDIFPEDLANKYIEDDKKVLKTKKAILVEEITVDETKEGSRFIVATRKLPWYDKDGNIAGIYGLGFDITGLHHIEELRKAKEKAEESEEKLRTIFNMSLSMICIADLNEATFLYINPAFTDILGYSEEELLDKSFLDFIHPEDIKPTIEVIEKELQAGKSLIHFENRYRCKDGKYVWLDWSSHPIPEKGITYAIAHDVSMNREIQNELIKAKEKAEESERKLLEAQELAHIGSWAYNIETDEVQWSKELYNIFERSHDLPAPNYSDQRPYYVEESFKILDEAVQNCIQHEIPYEIELDIITSSGAIKQIVSKGSFKKNKNNKIIALYGTAQDITQRKKIENELINAKKEAEEANRLKTEFIKNMSHEIRTPMNGIIGFSKMINKPDISHEKRKNYSKIIKNSSYQLLKIIDDILEISSLETKKEDVKNEKICLNDFLTELFAIFNIKTKEKNISFYLKKALKDEESYILCDKSKLNKILSNLIENALKFTNDGFIEFGYFIEKENLVIYIKDTGIGISQESQKIIFERFAQENEEISDQHGGLGLGLSIAKENTILLGGDIILESEKGTGSTFYVKIPFKKASVTNNEETRISESGNYLTVLIAEDEEVNLLFLDTLLENQDDFNVKVIHAKNGKEAVDICLNNKNIDLVLMDIKMPVMSGHEAAKKIKSIRPEVPIIAQTAYSGQIEEEFALKNGCDDFISKPINKDHLFVKIKNHIEKI